MLVVLYVNAMFTLSLRKGTFVAGLSVLFCSRPRPRGTTRSTVISVNTWVSIVQLLSTAFLLIGWVWSIVWGFAFLVISSKHVIHSTKRRFKLNQQMCKTIRHINGHGNGGGELRSIVVTSGQVVQNALTSNPTLLQYNFRLCPKCGLAF